MSCVYDMLNAIGDIIYDDMLTTLNAYYLDDDMRYVYVLIHGYAR